MNNSLAELAATLWIPQRRRQDIMWGGNPLCRLLRLSDTPCLKNNSLYLERYDYYGRKGHHSRGRLRKRPKFRLEKERIPRAFSVAEQPKSVINVARIPSSTKGEFSAQLSGWLRALRAAFDWRWKGSSIPFAAACLSVVSTRVEPRKSHRRRKVTDLNCCPRSMVTNLGAPHTATLRSWKVSTAVSSVMSGIWKAALQREKRPHSWAGPDSLWMLRYWIAVRLRDSRHKGVTRPLSPWKPYGERTTSYSRTRLLRSVAKSSPTQFLWISACRRPTLGIRMSSGDFAWGCGE